MYGLRRNSLLIPLACALLACATGVAYAQTGFIRGTLLDSNGNPVAKADVYAMFFLHCDVPDEATKAKIESGDEHLCPAHAMWDGRVDATTDDIGAFELSGLKWGVYELAAQKPEDGFRSTFRNVFMGEPAVRVVLSPASPYGQVTLHFPPKCALLTGTVKNAKTGELLSGVELRMRPKDDHGYYETSGAAVPLHILIPAEREFTLEIVARGFESWMYRNSFDKTAASSLPPAWLNLQPGEELHLNIALTPTARPPQ
jgi:hypothetical protein